MFVFSKNSSLLKRRVFFVLVVFVPFSLFAKDMGLSLDQSISYEDNGSTDGFKYSGAVVPWFSMPLSTWGDLYISAGVSVEYADKDWTIAPEIYRTE
jgi:hypothetical protein